MSCPHLLKPKCLKIRFAEKRLFLKTTKTKVLWSPRKTSLYFRGVSSDIVLCGFFVPSFFESNSKIFDSPTEPRTEFSVVLQREEFTDKVNCWRFHISFHLWIHMMKFTSFISWEQETQELNIMRSEFHILKTPNDVSLTIGALSEALIASANTLRVSFGSIIPSSQRRAEE